MKKTFSVFAALLMAALSLQAQDTVYSRSLSPRYLGQQWLIDTSSVNYKATWYPNHMSDTIAYLRAKYFYAKDPITVYGIAVAMCYYNPIPNYVYDDSPDNAYEYFALYNRVGDSAVAFSDSLVFHMCNTPVSYYQDFQIHDPGGGRFPVVPFSELYFNNPCKVQDTFLVGLGQRSSESAQPPYTFTTLPFCFYECMLSSPAPPRDRWEKTAYFMTDAFYAANGWRWFSQADPDYWLVYPILTPAPDTTNVDTVRIVTLLERYTVLQPNPAAERVLVTSSFGLQQIELYNAAGIKVYEQQATGYSAVLDVHTLPAGPYLARITTPRGTVTKKLIVQRR